MNMEAKIANVALQIARNGTARGRCDCWHRVGVLCCPSSRGVGGSGQGYNNLLDGGGKRSKSQFDFHHPRFQFHIAPWALRVPCLPRYTFIRDLPACHGNVYGSNQIYTIVN